MERRHWNLAALLSVLFVLGGCNTLEGAGQDIEAAGDAIEEEASDASR